MTAEVPHAALTREVIKRLRAMTPAQLRASLLRSAAHESTE